MPRRAEEEWLRLRRQLDLADGFWVGFLFTDSPRLANVFLARTEGILRARVLKTRVIRPESPQGLLEAMAELFRSDDAAAGVVWMEAVEHDLPGTGKGRPWLAAWEQFLLRLNERRERLRREIPGGFLLVAPTVVKPLARDAAPDLWSIRSIVLETGDDPGLPVDVDPRTESCDGSGAVRFDQPSSTDRAKADSGRGKSTEKRETNLDLSKLDASTLLRHAEAARLDGRNRDAIRAAGRAVALLEVSRSEREHLGRALFVQAQAELADGDPGTALEHIERALAQTSGPAGVHLLERLDLAAEAASRLNDLEAVLRYRDRAVSVARQLTEHARTPGSERSLSVSLGKLGDAEIRLGNTEAAHRAFAESLAIDRHIIEQHGESAEVLRDLSVSLKRAGDVELRLGRIDAARAAFAESLAMDRRIIERFGETPRTLRDLSVSLNRLGDVELQLGRIHAAGGAFAESLAIRRNILERQGETLEALRDLSVSLDLVGNVELRLGRIDAARGALAESLAIRRRVIERDGETPGTLRDLTVSLNRLGVVEVRLGKIDVARAASVESLAISRRILDQHGETPEALRDLAVSLNNVGDVELQLGHIDAAQIALVESVEISRRIIEQHGETPNALRDLAVSLVKLGDVALRLGGTDDAQSAFEESLVNLRRILEQCGETPEALRDLAESLMKVGDIEMQLGNPDAARRAFDEAATVLERLASLHENLGDEAGASSARSQAQEARRRLESSDSG